VETLTYSSGRASGCDSPGLLNEPDEGVPRGPGGQPHEQRAGGVCKDFPRDSQLWKN
jgi:hypothetical protein